MLVQNQKKKTYNMLKKSLIIQSLYILGSNLILAQSPQSYQELLLKHKNDLFPKVLIYDAPILALK